MSVIFYPWFFIGKQNMKRSVYFDYAASAIPDREVLELWMRLGRQMGRGGVDQQMQLFQHCFRELDRIETDVAEECKIQSKMYRSLGICLGVFLTVLLI